MKIKASQEKTFVHLISGIGVTVLLASSLAISSVMAQSSDDEHHANCHEHGENHENCPEHERHDKKRHHKKGERPHHDRMVKMIMEKVDTNQDGKIDLAEQLAHAEQRFNMMDADSDGFVTPEEGRKVAKEMRKKIHKKRKGKHEHKNENENED